jgi:hypothetical protein
MGSQRVGRRSLLVTVAALSIATTAWTQERADVDVRPLAFHHADEYRAGDGFLVVADRRVFAAMAFLNAMGYDEEADGLAMHPVRVRVRTALSERLDSEDERVEAWQAYYDALELPVFAILDYVLSFSTDYPFARVRPVDELQYPQTEPALRDLSTVLNAFWDVVDLGTIWNEVKPLLVDELDQYDFAKMRGQLTALWHYLRMERSDPFTLVNVPNLLERHYSALGARYDSYYFQVESPGAHDYGLNVHEYLHSIVNPLVKRHFDAHADKLQSYYEAGRAGPYARSYQSPRSMTQESLVRALDYRLRLAASADPDAAAKIQARIDEITEAGLAMTAPFYRSLAAYERSGVPFDEYLPELLAQLERR